MVRQKIIQLTKPLVIPGDSDVQQPFILSEFDSCDGFDPVFPAGFHKIHDPGGIVDVGQRQCRDMMLYGLFHQFLNGKRAVTEGVI